ncbi:hypothetical protein BGY98DRAFT_311966 [Russula aff. rugulosa BPL654]|nr:hypothetical protein BGY98DRAFT_311966 [Russula aff. rugulosa BPL654]
MRTPGVSARVAVTTTQGSRAATPASSVIGVLCHHRDGSSPRELQQQNLIEALLSHTPSRAHNDLPRARNQKIVTNSYGPATVSPIDCNVPHAAHRPLPSVLFNCSIQRRASRLPVSLFLSCADRPSPRVYVLDVQSTGLALVIVQYCISMAPFLLTTSTSLAPSLTTILPC